MGSDVGHISLVGIQEVLQLENRFKKISLYQTVKPRPSSPSNKPEPDTKRQNMWVSYLI